MIKFIEQEMGLSQGAVSLQEVGKLHSLFETMMIMTAFGLSLIVPLALAVQ